MVSEHLIDYNRENRIGISETIFCQDKSISQIKNICNDLNINNTTFFTRLKEDKYKNHYSINIIAARDFKVSLRLTLFDFLGPQFFHPL